VSNKFGILCVGTCNNLLVIERERCLLHILTRKYQGNDVVAYFVKAMRHYNDKEILVVPFNMSNHWVTLAISTKYNQVWYCDSIRPIDSIIGE
jgi:hypothetical protein